MHNVQTSIDQFVDWLKSRYSRNNPVLDLLSLIEMLRQENLALQAQIKSETDSKT
jgi:hypothetical protein